MKILIIDEDRDLVDWLGHSFRREGYTVVSISSREMAMRAFQAEVPDLVLLDLMNKRGLDLLQDMRRVSKTPVIILTAVNDEENIVRALKVGADDYVDKPFRPRELRARVEAVMRRSQPHARGAARNSTLLNCRDVMLDPHTREVMVAGRPVKLTPTERGVLEYLLLNQGIVVSVSDILENVWGYDSEQDDEVVRVTISRLRRKIEPNPSQPCYILNVPGEGYIIRADTPKWGGRETRRLEAQVPVNAEASAVDCYSHLRPGADPCMGEAAAGAAAACASGAATMACPFAMTR